VQSRILFVDVHRRVDTMSDLECTRPTSISTLTGWNVDWQAWSPRAIVDGAELCTIVPRALVFIRFRFRGRVVSDFLPGCPAGSCGGLAYKTEDGRATVWAFARWRWATKGKAG
jgi:hypothetical protein